MKKDIEKGTENGRSISKTKRGKTMKVIIGIILLCIVVFELIMIPPSMGKAPVLKDDNGNPLEGGISEKIQVDINGTSLGMWIMGRDKTKPVLLFCGGGPGIPEYLLEQWYPTGLEKEFVVCYIEYRGTGLSYEGKMDVDSVTTELYLEDVLEVTQYLRERFGQDKLYLMGHSFGSYIALNMAQRYPEYYHAYIAVSQICNQDKSEKLAYEYMKEKYIELGDQGKIKEFEKYPILTSQEAYEDYCTSMLRDTAMHELGVGTTRDMKSLFSGIILPTLKCKVYTPLERITIFISKMQANKFAVTDDAFHFNAFEQIPSLEIPVYFIAGKYDYTCCQSLQQEYFEFIQAPKKAFYLFENSAHSPLFEEADKAVEILIRDVLQ